MKKHTYLFCTKLILVLSLSFFNFAFSPPLFRDATAAKKTNLNGIWQGKASVDFGFGYREEFEYEMLLTQTGKKIVGFSTTTLVLRGKKYIAKAAIVGEIHGKYLKCRETHNVYEDKMPNSGWVPFSKMELIFKEKANYHTLEGLYECPDKTGGRLQLERKPPRV